MNQLMSNDHLHRKPGDRIIHPHRIKTNRLRRVLGVPAVFSAGYGNVGSSIFYALGIVAIAASGATPIALGIAGILFIFTALSYAEGTSMYPEAGGSASFALHGFNRFMGFIAGWALILSYIVTISISAFTIPPYLGYFWEPLKDSTTVGTAVAIGIIFFLMIMNIIGVKETSFINIVTAVMDIVVKLALVIIGLILLYNPPLLISRIIDNWPNTQNLILGIALSTIAYTGIETASQMAEETRLPEKRVPQALILMIISVLVVFAGISLVSFLAVTPQELGTTWARDPVAGIAANIPIKFLADVLRPLVAILAGGILLIATSAGIIGMSRLSFSLGTYHLVPTFLSRIHRRFNTPYLAIIIFSVAGIVILIPGFFIPSIYESIGVLYAFGSLLAFIFSHASIISLRIRYPQMERPFKLKFNINIRGRDIPLTAVLGLVATLAVWIIIVATQPFSRWFGIGWMVVGILVYVFFLRRRGASAKTTKNPETDI